MKTQTVLALKFILGMTILTGIIYPLFMTGVAQVIFPSKANGSMIIKDGKVIGSALIGQKSDSAVYFWPRPSAIDYNPIPSSGSNLGPTSDKLKKQMLERRKAFAVKNSIKDTTSIPIEMIFASSSGLDPHISPGAAMMQLNRVAASRNFNETQKQKVRELIKSRTERPQFSILGEPRINVFELNLALDKIRK
jgi:K+-transporting ATPase ATPase C chain